MFEERQLQKKSEGSRHDDSPTQRGQHLPVGTVSYRDTNYPYASPTQLPRNLPALSSDETSHEPATATTSSGFEEYIEEWRTPQLTALPSRNYNPTQSWTLPGIQSLPTLPPQATFSSDFFTILAQYHAYAVNRAQETKQRRDESIKKYREKKSRRNSRSMVKYQTRKQLAERRIRGPRGRFIPKEEENRILESQQALSETTREHSSPEQSDPLQALLQQRREAFVSPKFRSSYNRKPDGHTREQQFVDCNLLTDAWNCSPRWQFFP